MSYIESKQADGAVITVKKDHRLLVPVERESIQSGGTVIIAARGGSNAERVCAGRGGYTC